MPSMKRHSRTYQGPLESTLTQGGAGPEIPYRGLVGRFGRQAAKIYVDLAYIWEFCGVCGRFEHDLQPDFFLFQSRVSQNERLLIQNTL